MYANQISGGCSAFQAGVGCDILPSDTTTQQVHKDTEENMVTITRIFTKYLGYTVRKPKKRLSVFQKVTTLHELLKTNKREL
jgi:hypothetical protein